MGEDRSQPDILTELLRNHIAVSGAYIAKQFGNDRETIEALRNFDKSGSTNSIFEEMCKPGIWSEYLDDTGWHF